MLTFSKQLHDWMLSTCLDSIHPEASKKAERKYVAMYSNSVNAKPAVLKELYLIHVIMQGY